MGTLITTTQEECPVSGRRGFLLGLLGATAMGSTAFAQAKDFLWKHPGADPAFKTREAAMAARFTVFTTRFGYSKEVAQAVIAGMDAQNPGQVLIRKGQRFDHMMSSHLKVHAPTVVAFTTRPPEGLKDKDGEFMLTAEFWTVAYGGKTYNVYLPHVCHNWCDTVTDCGCSPAPTVHADCVYVRVALRQGDRLLSGICSTKALVPSPCFAQMEPGEIAFEKNFRMDSCGSSDCMLERPALTKGFDIPLLAEMQNGFTASVSGWYTFRLPHYFAEYNSDYYPIFCLEGFDGFQAAQNLSWSNFAVDPSDGTMKAYIVFKPGQESKTWTGKRPIIWHHVVAYDHR